MKNKKIELLKKMIELFEEYEVDIFPIMNSGYQPHIEAMEIELGMSTTIILPNDYIDTDNLKDALAECT